MRQVHITTKPGDPNHGDTLCGLPPGQSTISEAYGAWGRGGNLHYLVCQECYAIQQRDKRKGESK